MKRYFILCAALAAMLAPLAAPAREWKDKSGKYTVEAELVEVVGDAVRLKRADGKIVRLEISKLSPADQAFLKSQAGGGATATDRPGTTQPGTTSRATPAAPTKLDTTYITPDMFAAIIVHPQRMLKSPLAEKMIEMAGPDPFAQAEQQTGFDSRAITQAMLLVPAMKTAPTDMEPGMVLRFDAPVDGKKIAESTAKDFTEKTVAGRKYYAANGPANPSVYVADPKTVVIAKEALLTQMIAAKGTKSDLTDRLAKADMTSDFVALAAVEKNREVLKGLAASAPPIPGQDPAAAQNAAAMLDKIKAASVTLSLTNNDLLRIAVEGNDAAATAEISEHAKQMVEAAKAMYPLMTGQFQKGDPSQQKLVAIGGDAVKGLSTTTKGNDITVALKRPKDFNQLPELVQPLVQQAMMGGFGGPPGAAPPGFIQPGDAPGDQPGFPAPDDAGAKDAPEDLFGK